MKQLSVSPILRRDKNWFMRTVFTIISTLIFLEATAQNVSSLNQFPKQKIWINTTQGSIVKGRLVNASDTSLKIFTGSSIDRSGNSKNYTTQFYSNITDIKMQKKGHLVKSVLIGAGIGIAPVLIGSIFGKSTGEGGAYVTVVTLPVGVIIGAIAGISSKKKFFIGGDKSRFDLFRHRIKY
jgi:hypothetical protein